RPLLPSRSFDDTTPRAAHCDQPGALSPIRPTGDETDSPLEMAAKHRTCEANDAEIGPGGPPVAQVSCTVDPVAAERRAASRISPTMRLLRSDDGPDGLISPRTTAPK